MKFIRSILAVTTIAILSGCSSMGGSEMPKELKDPLPEQYERKVKEWEKQELPITLINSNTNFVIEKRKEIPERILDKKIKNLHLENADYNDLAFVLKAENINLFIGEEISGVQSNKNNIQKRAIGSNQSTIGNKTTPQAVSTMPKIININNFTGTVGELLDIIESMHNVSFNYKSSNTIFVEKTSLFLTATPQDEDTAKELVSSIESLGAREVTYSLSSGFMMYRATNREFEMIEEFFKHYYKNFATIKLQVSVITVDLKRDFNRGFDWSSLQASIGNLSLLNNSTIENIVNIGSDNNDNSSDSEVSYGNNLGSNLSDSKMLGAINGSQFSLLAQKGDADIQAVFNLLSQYGETTASQSIFLETISGKELNLENTREVPYTSNINSNVSGLGQSGFSASGFSAQTEKEGMNVKFVPYFNFNKNTVTLAIELDLKTITGFKQLNAGNGNGTVEQPETQEQKFNSVVEIIPGSTHLVGGIIYELNSDSRNNLNILDDYNTAGQEVSMSKNALFILLRPTVTIYSDLENITNIEQIELLNKYFRRDSIFSENKRTVIDPLNIKPPKEEAPKKESKE
jgi:hypothetical protein